MDAQRLGNLKTHTKQNKEATKDTQKTVITP
jgi:hypothetical protein